MKCSICGYKADCNCEFDNGICWTCKFGGRKINNQTIDNYCNQTLENLRIIKNRLKTQESTKLRSLQLTVVNSQIKQFSTNPCRWKSFIDNILVN